MTEPGGQHPDEIESTSPAYEAQQLRVVIVDPKDIPAATLSRARAHAQQLAVQLGLTKSD